MRTRVCFQRSVDIAKGDNLLQVDRKKRGYPSGGLVLVDVAKFVTQQTWFGLMTTTNENGIAQRETDRSRERQQIANQLLG